MKTGKTPLLAALITAITFVPASQHLFAGKGGWDLQEKTLDLHLYLTEKNSAQSLQFSTTDSSKMSYWFNEASKKMWNATEGHLRLGTIYVYNQTQVGMEDIDLAFVQGPEYAWAHVNGMGRKGWRMEFGMSYDGTRFLVPDRFIQSSLVHEFGHYGFGLWDEYLGHFRRATVQTNPETELQSVSVDPNFYPNPEPGRAGSDYWGWNGGGDSWMTAGRIFYSAWSLNDISWSDQRWTSSIMDLDFATSCTEFSWDGDYPYNLSSPNPQLPRGNLKEISGGIKNQRGRVLLPPGFWWVTTMQEERNKESCWATIARKLGIPNPTAPPSTTMPAEFSDIDWVVVDDRLSTVVCIDQSGSMAGYRLEQAKEGAKLFVNQAKTGEGNLPGDFVGMTAFSTSASAPAPIRELTNAASRQEILDAIDALIDQGVTSIGAGLEVSRQQVESVSPTLPLASETIVLLSDGMQNQNPLAEDILPAVKERGIKVFTISLGSGADLALMQKIADETNGKHFVVSSASDLQSAYAEIGQLAQEADSVGGLEATLLPGAALSRAVSINQGVEAASFVLTGNASGLELDLRNPVGQILNLDSAPGVESINSGNSRFIRISNPEAGNWTATVRAPSTPNPLSFSRNETPPAPIADGRGKLVRTISIPGEVSISSILPTVAIKHPFVGDLKVSLQGPDKTKVVLHDRSGTGKDLRGTYGMNLTPAGDLSTFLGKSTKGTWTLTIEDVALGDMGSLEKWSLAFNDPGSNAPSKEFELRATAKDTNISLVSRVESAKITYPGKAVLSVSLNANGPVSGADIFAIVTHPDGETESIIPLYDNGRQSNADEIPGDGTYSATFSGYTQDGVYNARLSIVCDKAFIDVSGNVYNDENPAPIPVEKFSREDFLQFDVAGVPSANSNVVQVALLSVLKDGSNIGKLSAKGFFNADQQQYHPKKSRIQIAFDDYNLNLNASDFAQRGRTFNYQVKPNRENNLFRTISITILPNIGGTSKSSYSVTASKEDLRDITFTEGVPEVDFRFSVGNLTDSATLVGTAKQSPTSASFSYQASANGEKEAALYIQAAGVKLNPKKQNRDSCQILAQIPGWNLTGSLSSQSVSISIGGLEFDFPAGSLVLQRDGSYRANASGKNITLAISPEKRTLQLTAKNQQIGGISNPAIVGVTIGSQTQIARLFISRDIKKGTYAY